MPKPFLLQARQHRHGGTNWLNEWHTTRAEAWAAHAELLALGWTHVTLTEVQPPPQPVHGRLGLACGAQHGRREPS
jgi:hypothetical protein